MPLVQIVVGLTSAALATVALLLALRERRRRRAARLRLLADPFYVTPRLRPGSPQLPRVRAEGVSTVGKRAGRT